MPAIPVWTIRPWAAAPEVVVTAACAESGTSEVTGISRTPGVSVATGTWTQSHAAILSPAERALAARFATPELAYRWSAARVLLRVVLADRLDIDPHELQFERTDTGKPILGGVHERPVSFSLTHTGAWVAVATSPDRSLGVDAETRVTSEVAKDLIDVFTPIEQRQLTGLRDDGLTVAITQLWTRKEAYLKALGTGLLRDPSLDTVGAGLQPNIPADAPEGTTLIDLPLLPDSDIHAALCVMGS